MASLTNLVGVLLNSEMISSGNARIINAMGSSNLYKSAVLTESTTAGKNSHLNKDANAKSDPNILALIFIIVTSVLRICVYKILRGLWTLTGMRVSKQECYTARSGGVKKRSSNEGDAMAMLTGLAYQAFYSVHRQPVGVQAELKNNEIPLGIRAPINAVEENELEQTAGLIIKGMINAAKADSQVGYEEIQEIVGRIRESDSDDEIQRLIFKEMQLPLDLEGLVNEIPNEMVAAQVYVASLFTIEVNTPAEREYLEQFLQRTGLDTDVAQQLNNVVGVRSAGF